MTLKLRPSQSKSWGVCTAQPSFLESIKDRLPPEDDTFTGPGILAHKLAAQWLETGVEPEFPDPEMHAAVRDYVAQVKILQGSDGFLLTEQNLPIPYPSSANGGTLDAMILRPGRIIVVDLKYGQGVSVEAVGNTQLLIYGWMAYLAAKDLAELSNDTEFELYIFQPRAREGQPLREWMLSFQALSQAYSELHAAAEAIEMGAVEFCPQEDVCRFCPARKAGLCSAYVQKQAEMSGLELLDAPAAIPSAHALTPEQRSRILLAKKDLVSFLNAVEEAVMAEALAGKPVPGWKLVAGRPGNRKWKDEEAAAKLLSNHLSSDERYTKKLISPTQAEKLLADKNLSTRFSNRMDELVTREEGKPSLAPETDPRPELVLTAESAGISILE